MSAIGNPNISRGPLVPTVIEWPYGGHSVYLYCSFGQQWVSLQRDRQNQYVTLHLPSGVHDIWFNVDGDNQFHPLMSFRNCNGKIINTVSVNPTPWTSVSSIQRQPRHQLQQAQAVIQDQQDEVLVPITFKQYLVNKDDRVQVEGSWDEYTNILTMERSNDDHYYIKCLKPGKYPYKYIVNGKRRLNPSVQMGHRSEGTEGTNILNVLPEMPNNEPLGAGCQLLGDFLGSENPNGKIQLTEVFKFCVGNLFGSIGPDEELYPCSEVGFMLTNGFFTCARQKYLQNLCWAGSFMPKDMVVVDGRHCQIRKKATFRLTRVNILLDNLQMKKSLLLRYQRNGKYPPDFMHLFWLLENPPNDFDTNAEKRIEYLDRLWKAAALATSSQRMHLLINVAQFYKQLSKEKQATFAIEFNELLQEYSNWQEIVHLDALLESVYMDRREMKIKDGKKVEPVPNTGLELSYFLRIFYVHGPEHTLSEKDLKDEPFIFCVDKDGKRPVRRIDHNIKDESIQYLQSFKEFDMIVSYFLKLFFGRLVCLVRSLTKEHQLLKSAWDFYCDKSLPL